MFWKKKKESTVQTKEIVLQIELATAIILSTNAYLEAAEQMAKGKLISVDHTRKAYHKLVMLGLENTQNALALKKELDTYNSQVSDRQTANKLIDFVKVARKCFGPKTFLVSNTQFEKLCNKYGLAIGPLTSYKGVIPVENIEDIAKVKDNLTKFYYSDLLNENILHITSMNLKEEDAYIITDYVKKHNNIVILSDNSHSKEDEHTWWAQDVPDLRDKVRWQVLNKLIGNLIGRNDLLIACPPKYLNNPKVTISKKAVDPAIFQYCPYGVLIHTIWGEEAEDVVLKQYLETNNKIVQSF